MNELKLGRRTYVPVQAAGQARVPQRAQVSANPQHSVWDDESRFNIASPRSAASSRWKGFVIRLRITDAAAIAVSVASAYLVRFGSDATAALEWDARRKIEQASWFRPLDSPRHDVDPWPRAPGLALKTGAFCGAGRSTVGHEFC